MDIWLGRSYPLEVTDDGIGTNVTLFSERAERVERYLFEDDGKETRDNLPEMAKILHEAGIDVTLDMVYSHTAEGNHLGPMLAFKGIDNAAYDRLVADNPRYDMDDTETENSPDMRHPNVIQFMMDPSATGSWQCTWTDFSLASSDLARHRLGNRVDHAARYRCHFLIDAHLGREVVHVDSPFRHFETTRCRCWRRHSRCLHRLSPRVARG